MGMTATGYHLLGGGIVQGFVEAGIVPPVNPVHGGELDLGEGFPGLRIE